MLAELFIDNFIIIKRNHIIFEDGFNVLTGETGSGKSLILEAINLLLGKKASKDVVGKFSDKATIEGIFILDEKNKKILEDNTIIFDEDDNKLIVNRTIGKKSSTLRINGRIVNLASLREIAPILVDIYKQGDSNAFMNKANYIYLIDSYSNDKETINLKKTIKSLVSKRNEFLEKFDHLNLSDEEISRERDLIEYQISEIDQVDLSNINEEEIDEEYRKLTSINEIREAIENSKSILDSSEYDTISATEMINKSMTELSAITDLDDKLSVFYDRLSSLNDEIGDIYSEMDLYEENLIGDSYRQQELEDLMEIIFKLKRKYGRSIEDILDFYDNISKRLEELNEIDDLKNNLDKIISEIDSKLEKNALILHEIRNNKSKIIEEKINKSIRELNIKNGLFKIKISQKNRIDINGLDDVDFLIRTNKGEDLKSLQNTASGGEISRIMLAFKEIFADFDDVDTMIFDEIDTGISGRTAQIVGEKILDLSKNRQVISISHLPQIAALANNHLLISKKDEENFTISSTKKIENKDRVEEIARLIGGVNITKTTIDSASEILTMAQELTNERR
ncbi:DNA repair protein RecN [Anaerococcus sp. Marseille-P3625]|uniref:DNA repair protein RecN n=1 Tax=Anaerococcus sp. Marseille-P3625 TaxID=1977277 RepID=UPI000C07DC88|nr:DNA repair protein RecN [Anaerococcus sp. Marseille-P3625]